MSDRKKPSGEQRAEFTGSADDQSGLAVCAGAVVRDADGRLLLIRRRHDPSAGLWSIPGGRVEPGELPEQAAAREVLEETGLAVSVGALLGTVVLAGRYLVHDFAATVVGGTLRAGDDATDARWCAPAEVRALELTPGLLDELARMGLDLSD
jgi:ADP-ribose pyrophosphatase YjhB (NUDIX family)